MKPLNQVNSDQKNRLNAIDHSKGDTTKVGKFIVYHNKLLGQGGFGKVFFSLKDGQRYACKVIPIDHGSKDLFKSIQCELSVMQVIKHQNLVSMVDYTPVNREIYIFMEFCKGGNIESLIPQNYRPQQEQIVLNVLYDVMEGLNKLYEHNVIHRDIKPQNILQDNGTYKLSDFGLSKIVQNAEISYMTTCLGTPLYSSPQILRSEPYTSKTDIWSLGVTLFELIFGQYPFNAANERLSLLDISNGNSRLKMKLRILQNQFLREIIEKMLQESEEKRISFKELYLKVINYKTSQKRKLFNFPNRPFMQNQNGHQQENNFFIGNFIFLVTILVLFVLCILHLLFRVLRF